MSDSRSMLSDYTNTSTLGIEFDFDTSLLGSKAYRAAYRSNLRQLITLSRAAEPKYSSFDSSKQLPLHFLQNSVEESFSPLESSDSGLPSSPGHNPSYHNDSPRWELEQNAEKFSQCNGKGSHLISGYLIQPPLMVQKRVEAPTIVDKALDVVSCVSESPHKTDAALVVSPPSSRSKNTEFLPKSTLLRSLRSYWHARTTNQATSGVELGVC